MVDVFVSKVRPVGSSLGVIIPKAVIDAEGLADGKEVRVSVFNTDFSRLRKLMGTVAEKVPFERDRRDRV